MNGPQWSARSSWHTFPGHPVDTGIPRADSASPVPARAAPHTRASACTRACTLYGCAARAPHGNDESSTLEHLSPLVHSVAHSLSVPYTRFPLASSLILGASRSRISVAPPLNPTCRTIGLCLPYVALPPRVCKRAYTRRTIVCVRNVGRGGRVMISRLFTRALSLFRAGSSPSFARSRAKSRSSLSLALRSGVGKFAWPRGYVFVSNDLCR